MAQFTDKEQKLFKMTAALVFVVVGADWAAAKYSVEFKFAQENEQRNLSTAINDVRGKLDSIEEQRTLLRANRQTYQESVDRGLLGEQDPIVWIKAMKNIQERRKLQPVSYQFSSEQLVGSEDSSLLDGSNVQVKILEMQLSMPMLHGLDIFMFLEDLDKDADSFFFPVSCEFDRATDDFVLINRENIRGLCQVDWFFVSDPESNLVKSAS